MTIETIYRLPTARLGDNLKVTVFHALHGKRHILRASFAGRSVQKSFSIVRGIDLHSMPDLLARKYEQTN